MMIQTASILLSAPRLAPQGNPLAKFVQKLVEADRRARERRRLDDLPDRLRLDAGLPPRPHMEQAVRNLMLRAALMR